MNSTAWKAMNNIELEKKIKSCVHALAYEKGYVCSVDVLLKLGYLSKKDYEDWRFKRVACLENVCTVNLNKLSLINKTIKRLAKDRNLEPSWTGYNKYGKGPSIRLRFSKSGIKAIEDGYATHYMDKKRMLQLKAEAIQARPVQAAGITTDEAQETETIH
jgi:hypothetical protein